MGAIHESGMAPGMDPEGTAEVFRTMGAAEEQIEKYLASRQAMVEVEREPFELWPENEQALELFLAVFGSWRTRGMSGAPVGIDESAIHARMQVMQEPHNLELYDDVVAMGRAAAAELVERYFD